MATISAFYLKNSIFIGNVYFMYPGHEMQSLPLFEKRLQKIEFLAYQVSARGSFFREMSSNTGRCGQGRQEKTVWSGTLTR